MSTVWQTGFSTWHSGCHQLERYMLIADLSWAWNQVLTAQCTSAMCYFSCVQVNETWGTCKPWVPECKFLLVYIYTKHESWQNNEKNVIFHQQKSEKKCILQKKIRKIFRKQVTKLLYSHAHSMCYTCLILELFQKPGKQSNFSMDFCEYSLIHWTQILCALKSHYKMILHLLWNIQVPDYLKCSSIWHSK